MSYHFYSGGEDRRYCYAAEATYKCQWADAAPAGLCDAAEEAGEWGWGITKLPQMFKLAHQRTIRIRDRDENGKLTTRCAACGAELEKVGYATWVEAPWDQIDVSSHENLRATRDINLRLGNTHGRVPGQHRYFPKKREAIAWCQEQAQIDRAATREEAAAGMER